MSCVHSNKYMYSTSLSNPGRAPFSLSWTLSAFIVFYHYIAVLELSSVYGFSYI